MTDAAHYASESAARAEAAGKSYRKVLVAVVGMCLVLLIGMATFNVIAWFQLRDLAQSNHTLQTQNQSLLQRAADGPAETNKLLKGVFLRFEQDLAAVVVAIRDGKPLVFQPLPNIAPTAPGGGGSGSTQPVVVPTVVVIPTPVPGPTGPTGPPGPPGPPGPTPSPQPTPPPPSRNPPVCVIVGLVRVCPTP